MRLNQEMKDRYEDKVWIDWTIVQVAQLETMAEGNYKRHTVTHSMRPLRVGCRTGYSTTAISRNGRKSYPTIYQSYVAKELNVDYLTRNAERLLGFRPMKIRYGNGATVVVRARESLVHGEGWQLTFLIQINGKCVRHYEKSRKSIKQSVRAQQSFGL